VCGQVDVWAQCRRACKGMICPLQHQQAHTCTWHASALQAAGSHRRKYRQRRRIRIRASPPPLQTVAQLVAREQWEHLGVKHLVDHAVLQRRSVCSALLCHAASLAPQHAGQEAGAASSLGGVQRCRGAEVQRCRGAEAAASGQHGHTSAPTCAVPRPTSVYVPETSFIALLSMRPSM
jgi:hypothetical protein